MSYFGGKAQDGVYQTIINQIPLHDIYIEPFLGGGAIMLKKKPAKQNIGIELDSQVVNAFIPVAHEVEIINGCAFDYLRSLKGVIAYLSRKTFSGTANAKIPTGSEKGNFDYERSPTFIYCDPPYPKSTRGKTRYKFELSDSDHYKLLDILKCLHCSVALSTYPNQIYKEKLKDWRLLEYNSVDRSGKVRIENLYMNYPEPVFLHDDRYLGDNANNRQDIKRRIARTKRRVLNWDARERIKLMRELIRDLPEDEKNFLVPHRQK